MKVISYSSKDEKIILTHNVISSNSKSTKFFDIPPNTKASLLDCDIEEITEAPLLRQTSSQTLTTTTSGNNSSILLTHDKDADYYISYKNDDNDDIPYQIFVNKVVNKSDLLLSNDDDDDDLTDSSCGSYYSFFDDGSENSNDDLLQCWEWCSKVILKLPKDIVLQKDYIEQQIQKFKRESDRIHSEQRVLWKEHDNQKNYNECNIRFVTRSSLSLYLLAMIFLFAPTLFLSVILRILPSTFR